MATTTRSGISIFYREIGEGEPILFIQGLEVDNRGWAAIVPAFRDRYRCISLDNRDIGQSEFVPGGYTVADMARDAIAVLDEAGVESAHIVGFSMGGAIAQELAIDYPDRVKKLVLIGTFPWLDERLKAANRSRIKVREQLSVEDYTRANFPNVYTSRDYDQPGLIEGIIERVVANAAAAQPNDAFARQSDAIRDYDSRERLKNVRAETLVICGEEDYLCPPWQSRLIADAIPGAKLEFVEGAGHGVVFTRGADVSALMAPFLEG